VETYGVPAKSPFGPSPQAARVSATTAPYGPTPTAYHPAPAMTSPGPAAIAAQLPAI
jgi:hypothetical protein